MSLRELDDLPLRGPEGFWRAYGTEQNGQYLWRTTTVGSYRPNAFGLYDMHGNVSEWCADFYSVDYYAESPPDDPNGPSSDSFRVNRGGSWSGHAGLCRSANRFWDTPDYRDGSLGFRVVRVPAE